MAIDKVAVIGGGLMGSGIAQVAAMAGQEVSLVEVSEDILGKALERVRSSLDKLSAKGQIQETTDIVLQRIKPDTSISRGLSDADLIVEAVFEDIDLKRRIVREATGSAPGHAILATNTSGLSIGMIAEATDRKEKVVGMHWMNPPQLMKLVEVVRSKYTDDETLEQAVDLCRIYGKEPLVVQRDVWYFLAARAHYGWSLTTSLTYLAGEAGFKEIDAVSRYRMGLPMGPFELSDFTGAVNIRTGSLRSVDRILKSHPEFEPWPLFLAVFRHLVNELWGPMKEKGLTGVAAGKGYYTYHKGEYSKPDIPGELAEKVDPIQLLAPAINMAARCVSEGLGTIHDINKSFRLAYGWPKGIFEYIDMYSIDDIIYVLKARKQEAPEWLKDFYRIDTLLERRFTSR
ncbi:3-hydroxyacyl-CoA dehydrogenase NAD-binding domain-containing protein [Chloroflexota bacterium]